MKGKKTKADFPDRITKENRESAPRTKEARCEHCNVLVAILKTTASPVRTRCFYCIERARIASLQT